MTHCRLVHEIGGSSESDDSDEWTTSASHPLVQTNGWQHVAGVFDPTTEGTTDASRWNMRHLSRVNGGGIGQATSDETYNHQSVLDEVAQLRKELGLQANANAED